jgi:spermidine synthase
VASVICRSPGAFDAILLDVDNGPEAITDPRNDQLYSPKGIRACLDALRPGGCLAVWSAFQDAAFERRLRQEQVHVQCIPAPTYKGARSRHCCIWVCTPGR